MDDYDSVLKFFCESDAMICRHPYVFPCTWCAESLKISLYRVRKAVKQLVTDGYLVKDSEGGWDEWSGHIYCLRGYSLTEKARQHQFWKDMNESEIRYWDGTMQTGEEGNSIDEEP